MLDPPKRLAVFGDIQRFGSRIALIGEDGTAVSYRELSDRIDSASAQLGPTPRLVVLSCRNTIDTVVMYLAALQGGHPVLLVPGDGERHLDGFIDAFDPDVVIRQVDGGGLEVSPRRSGTRHVLHPDLAVLLSTSGTTGSTKLVRLSHDNLRSNAASIARFLEIDQADRAATTLPMHYCYGLSVVNSHLRIGAGLIVTERSVVDPCFWRDFDAHEGTSIAGVPYTFDLLDRIRFVERDTPTLRYITQAGGRLAPERVSAYATAGERRGWKLFVMYGQTEATARMAYVPPDRIADHPAAIGVPIPGGSLHLDESVADEPGVGELVYRGRNVMMGYASEPSHLSEGRTVHELRTGDLGRLTPDGMYEVVGRRSRFIKLFGLRIDLDSTERLVNASGHRACCTGTDELLVVGVERRTDDAADRSAIVTVIGDALSIPTSAVEVVITDELPRLPNGKPDLVVVRNAGLEQRAASAKSQARPKDSPARTVHDVFGVALHSRVIRDSDSFQSLGGDSLSYVEVSIRLEEMFGSLPTTWHIMSVADLERLPRRRSTMVAVETTIAIRAIGILAVVGTHFGLFRALGGAHAMLAVAGYNVARFQLPRIAKMGSVRPLLRSALLVLLPTAVVLLLRYGPSPVRLDPLANYWNRDSVDYWFVDALVQILVALALFCSWPGARRWGRDHPYEQALLLVAATLALRFSTSVWIAPSNVDWMMTHHIAWIFACGLLIRESDTFGRRVVASLLSTLPLLGFFDTSQQNITLGVAMLILIWIPRIPIIRPIHRAFATVASASLYIYLTHFVFSTHLANDVPVVEFGVAVVGGVAVWFLVDRLTTVVSRRWVAARSGFRSERRLRRPSTSE